MIGKIDKIGKIGKISEIGKIGLSKIHLKRFKYKYSTYAIKVVYLFYLLSCKYLSSEEIITNIALMLFM